MREQRKPISAYCRQDVPDWGPLPEQANLALNPHGVEYSCGFIRIEDGANVIASVKDYGALRVIHLTVAPIRWFRKDLSDEEHARHLFAVTPEIIHSFFGDRAFARQPDDARTPLAKHYFSLVEENE